MTGEKEIRIVVYGEPTPKGRPKVARRGQFSTIYTPQKTRDAEQSFQAQALRFKPEQPIKEAISVSIFFFKLKPKSMPKKVIHWTKKPDIDNMAKLVLDAMNKIFFQDDAQITELICHKAYSENPRTEVIIRKV